MVAVITGASGGIGRETARVLLQKGWQVICLQRHDCDVKGAQNIKCDITKQAEIDAAFAKIDQIDLLINNAGFGVSGCVEYTDMREIRAQFELNFFAHIAVTKAALPKLRESRGRIVFISSAASVFSIPFQSFYSATKAAQEAVSFALLNELKPFGISACAIRLGDVKTGFTAARQKDFAGDDVYGGAIARSVAVMESDETNGMRPEYVAQQIVRIAQKKRLPAVATVGGKYKVFCLLQKILPAGLVNKIVGMMYMPKK